jgi:hypothetical protein
VEWPQRSFPSWLALHRVVSANQHLHYLRLPARVTYPPAAGMRALVRFVHLHPEMSHGLLGVPAVAGCGAPIYRSLTASLLLMAMGDTAQSTPPPGGLRPRNVRSVSVHAALAREGLEGFHEATPWSTRHGAGRQGRRAAGLPRERPPGAPFTSSRPTAAPPGHSHSYLVSREAPASHPLRPPLSREGPPQSFPIIPHQDVCMPAPP